MNLTESICFAIAMLFIGIALIFKKNPKEEKPESLEDRPTDHFKEW